MSTFKDYVNKDRESVIIQYGHHHIEKTGKLTGPPLRIRTDDGRITHYHKQSDGGDTTEARSMNRFLYNDDIEGSLESLPQDGPHVHMQTDGQHTSEEVVPEKGAEPDGPAETAGGNS